MSLMQGDYTSYECAAKSYELLRITRVLSRQILAPHTQFLTVKILCCP